MLAVDAHYYDATFALAHRAVTAFASWAFDSKTREMSTTVAFVKMLTSLLKLPEMESASLPIVADKPGVRYVPKSCFLT